MDTAVGCPLERDLLITRGWAVFTVLRARNHILLRQEDHLQRLIDSCRGARIDLAGLPPHDELLQRIWQKIDEYNYPESVVRIIVTAGHSEDSKHPAPTGRPRIVILVDPYHEPSGDPVRLISRIGGPLRPEVKMIGPYANAMVDLHNVSAEGYDDVLYTTATDDFKETTCGNIFFVTQTGELWTPREHVLRGITRDIVMHLATEKKIFRVVEEPARITHNHIGAIEEAFRTASISGITPVSAVDAHNLKVGEGTKTALLQDAYREYVDQYFTHRGAP